MPYPASSITVLPIALHDTKAFLRVPWRVYHRDHCWVPPLQIERRAFLNPHKNPFFQHAQVQLFLAQHQGETVGRIAAVINQAHDQFHGERAGFFGLFECLPEAASAATALLQAATTWVQARGATFLRGPVNFSMNELDCGLLVEGFGAAPVFHSAYNPPYYAEFIEASGFTKCKDLLAFYRHYHPWPSARILQLVERLQARRNLTIRPINMHNFRQDIAQVAAIYNDAWSDNWGFVPLTDAEAQHMASALRLAIIPEVALLAELDGEVIGCFITLPDLNQLLQPMRGRLTPWGMLRFLTRRRRLDTVRIAIMGVKKRYRRLGVDLMLYVETWKQAATVGVVRGEAAWILEDNHLMIRALEALGASAYKRYRLYQKDIE
ncbi:MAG: N-acetyltransferase [Candidatus Tectomicrobia bacterium]|uniref:N-acetyltransferase n=1 Tax=Tectimicrobiota bacterium TaxID=2528274 RepID=A0A937VYK6_UNCTE|nr:N-acetyltransferase [Candidatus Tectomicrobia bacterium]